MTGRWRWPLALVAIVFATSCAAQSGAGGGRTQSTTSGGPAAVPFASFLASVSAAKYGDYAGTPGARVRDSAAVQQMREFLLTKYQGAQVARTFSDSGGGVFDCVRQAEETASAPTPASTPPGAESDATGTRAGAAGTTGTCPDGSVPTRRIALTDLVRFPTLQDYLGKAPGGGQLPTPPSPSSTAE